MRAATPPLVLRRGLLLATIVAVVAAIALVGTQTLAQSFVLAVESHLLSPGLIAGLLPLAIGSYGLRIIRWHLLARRVVPELPLAVSAHGQIVGFGFAPTPGRVAELYKLKIIAESTGAPVAQFVPAAFLERLTDLAGFGLVVLAGVGFSLLGGTFASTFGQTFGPGPTWWLAASLVTLLVLVAVPLLAGGSVGRRYGAVAVTLGRGVWRLAGSLPGGRMLVAIVADLERGGRQALEPRTLALAVGCVAVGRVFDSLVLWRLALAIGHPIPWSFALLAFGSAGLLGGITFSPGGLGAAEMALVGLLVARGLPLEGATVVALGTRALTFWIWVSLGLATFALGIAARTLTGTRVPLASATGEDEQCVEKVARSA